MCPTWCRVGASVIGTSHEEAEGYCEDSAVSIERNGVEGPVLISVVSDGAGSVSRGKSGSRTVVRRLGRASADYVLGGGIVSELTQEIVQTWMDDLRDAIAVKAEAEGLALRDYSATLVAALVSPDCAVVIHVGDGACVISGGNGYIVPSWPAHGEYASTTHFVTDEVLQLQFSRTEGEFGQVAVFSDGLELLLLEHSTRAAFTPFFESAFGRIRELPAGRSRTQSQELKGFLGSDKIARRTDDDKTLLLACRAPQPQ